ncbi:MAG: hypothetical protein JHC37_02435 [Campylobacteraceae bacterium]|jgi:hypothetical protein|nr:hypothetical protein [Campylobacteraceae bacterium]
MNKQPININYQNWIEYDYNPFFVFGSKGELLTLNQPAQFLISKVDPKALYELATLYASRDFGYKTTIIDLKFDVFSFFALTVGYESEDEIGIKLYQTPYLGPKKIISIKECELTNIYHMLDLCIATVAPRLKAEFKKDIDPALPDFKLSQNEFVKILTRSYESFEGSKEITTELKLKTGEFLQISGKRFQILKLKITGDMRATSKDALIEEMGSNINIFTSFDENEAALNIPLIL